MDQSLNFNEFAQQIWPKYTQIAFYDMADDRKTEPANLGREHWENGPPSMMSNIDDYRVFRNFVDCEYELEVRRRVKLQELEKVADAEVTEAAGELDDLVPESEEALEALTQD